MQPTRTRRLAQQLQQEIAAIIQQELKDPRLGFVTITRVELSADGSYATAWFSCLGSEQERRRSQDVLAHSAGFIRTLIKQRFRLRVIPEIRFRYDVAIEGSIAMSDMLDRLKESHDE